MRKGRRASSASLDPLHYSMDYRPLCIDYRLNLRMASSGSVGQVTSAAGQSTFPCPHRERAAMRQTATETQTLTGKAQRPINR